MLPFDDVIIPRPAMVSEQNYVSDIKSLKYHNKITKPDEINTHILLQYVSCIPKWFHNCKDRNKLDIHITTGLWVVFTLWLNTWGCWIIFKLLWCNIISSLYENPRGINNSLSQIHLYILSPLKLIFMYISSYFTYKGAHISNPDRQVKLTAE